MEIPLTPVEFARRARRLYAEREAVVDGDPRLNYEQFLERCDRWSTALQVASDEITRVRRMDQCVEQTHRE
jgi:non-ribosomal peptide synthetase component E (peptide arylation enzyme)